VQPPQVALRRRRDIAEAQSGGLLPRKIAELNFGDQNLQRADKGGQSQSFQPL